jgi:GxxExxY protein
MIYKQETYKIIGAAMKVHNEMGTGFLEAVYQEALEIEFELSEIPYKREKELPLSYRGRPLKSKYKADFICFDNIVIELKALACLNSVHEAQVLNYLKATGLKLGILLNFGEESLKYRRLIRER